MILNAKKIVTAAATASLVFGAMAPSAFAATSLEISGNGSSSTSTAAVSQTNSNTVTQSNTANITNSVSSTSNTGGNSANDNTGGHVLIDTGNSSSSVDLRTKANVNVANTPNCNCNGDTAVTISGNGSNSSNDATVANRNSTTLFQTNDANINNRVDVTGKTGGNDANRNTGGDVTVITGHASSDVSVSNQANANVARSTSAGAGAGAGTLSAKILGNGSSSDNSVALDNSNSNTVVQSNDAYFNNDVRSRLDTGRNDANDNTGGNVLVDTGNATSSTDVSNAANFNWADMNCGCLLDTSAKIAGNGSYSSNDILADLSNDNSVFQTGAANFRNNVRPEAQTGDNYVNRNTGSVFGGDPTVITGHSMSDVSVSNTSNANVVGSTPGFAFTWDLGGLMNMLGM